MARRSQLRSRQQGARALRLGGRFAAGLTGVALGGMGVTLIILGVTQTAAPMHASTGSGPPSVALNRGAPGPDAPSASGLADPSSDPVLLDIPSIEVHTDLVPLGLNEDGTVMVPPTQPSAPAGWYQYLVPPGEPGPAVILGHVDSTTGPAVFYRLGELEPGASIFVRRADGRTIQFAVDSVHTYLKSNFPSEAVYGPTADPVLRLVTCGGPFDRARRTYLSNVVVYATLLYSATG